MNHTIIIVSRANSVKDFVDAYSVWGLTPVVALLSSSVAGVWRFGCPSCVEVISMPVLSSRVVNTAALGAKSATAGFMEHDALLFLFIQHRSSP